MPTKKQDDQPRAPFPEEIEGGGIRLALTRDEVYFETAGVLAEEELNELMRRHRLEEQSHVVEPHPASFNAAFPDRRWARIPQGETIEAVVARLEADERVRVASPVYHRPDLNSKTALSFSDRVLAKVHTGADVTRMAESAYQEGEPGVTVTAEIEQTDGVLVRLRVSDPKRENALECASRFSRLGEVKEVHPDWLTLIPSIATTTPNDPLFAQQWDMAQIGAPLGWDLTEGSASVVIAIVDTGCDLNHEDLVSKYVPVASRRDVVAGTNTPNDDFGHGTCCASLAAAATNNGLGIAGVGWNCEVMPIKLLSFGFINSEADIVSAIDWARTNGANVVSMSWYWTGTTSNADVAFAAAAAANLVMVAASGNFNVAPVVYPALNPHIMAIGASDKIDKRKSPASPDGECWGSNFGAKQSVISPGLLCWAANNTNGGASFNDNNGGPINWACVNYASSGTADEKYFAEMNGTSAATPHVAGLAGLLLSVNPGLTNTEVRNIIEQTADKTGGYAYANDPLHPNGTWHQEPGYGRINVFSALKVLFPHVATAIVSGGKFGNACVGSFIDETLTINNTGAFAALKISNITSSSPDFLAPSVAAYPLVVNPGDSIEVVIRFQPTSPGVKSATISVLSNDPASPHTVLVSGDAPAGKLSITGSTVFGGVRCCHREQRTLNLCNTGDCSLHVSDVGLKHKRRHLRLINNPFPATIHSGSFLSVVLEYFASERVPKPCELIIKSDDPDDPVRTLEVIAYTIWDCCTEPRKECCEEHRCGCKERRRERCEDDFGEDDDWDDD